MAINLNAIDLIAIKERVEETSFKQAYVKGDAWKGYEVKDEYNGMVLAEVSCGTDADLFVNARQDITSLIAEVERLRRQQARLIAELEKADKFSDELRAELFRQQLPGIRKLAEDYVKEREEESHG